jgi:repressor of nif and glnA expression
MNIVKEADANLILKIINNAGEPLETKEIENLAKKLTRVKILYRLNQLRAEGLIKGKQIGSGKGTWIWWKNNMEKR